MGEFNYTLIVSQYRYSRHSFIVKHDTTTFLESAKKLTEELEKYKRSDDCTRDIDYGDLTYHKDIEIHRIYNVSDYGDIYFHSSKYANYLMHDAIEYAETSMCEAKGYKRNDILNDIALHHSFDKVKEIVEKHFEIV